VKIWPTPTVNGNNNRKGVSKDAGDGLATAVRREMFPTPMASEAHTRPQQYARGNPNLAAHVERWPTPTASLGTKGGRVTPRKARHGGTLIEAVSASMPTPTVSDATRGAFKDPEKRTKDGRGRQLVDQAGGSLNPGWVEWLMGYMVGWTRLSSPSQAGKKSRPSRASRKKSRTVSTDSADSATRGCRKPPSPRSSSSKLEVENE
jgi:hypothetical protein